jgi:hypothetical protein
MILLWIMILRLTGLIDVLDVRILINYEKKKPFLKIWTVRSSV